MAESGNLNILIETGTDFVLPFTIYDNNGDPLDLTGATVESQLREYAEAYDFFEFACMHNGSGGRITVTMPHETTAQIPFTHGVYDVKVTLADGTISHPLSGEAYIKEGVTKSSDGSILFMLGINSFDDLPEVGNVDRLYFVYGDRKIYRWNGTNYVATSIGNGIEKIEFVEHVDTFTDKYRITYDDGTHFDYLVTTRGIDHISLIGSTGTVRTGVIDQYRIYFSDDTTHDYYVTNGRAFDVKTSYDATQAYEYLDMVKVDGATYVAVQDVPADTAITNTDYWLKIIAPLTMGTVTTVGAQELADASIGGTADAPVLNLTIPRGATGNESIDDTKGKGDTDYVWSADRSSDSINYQLDNSYIEIEKSITWQNGYVNTSGTIKSSTASGFALVPLTKGEIVRIGTKNNGITMIGSTTAQSVDIGDTVNIIARTYSGDYVEYVYEAKNDINIVLCVLLANYKLHFYNVAESLKAIDTVIDIIPNESYLPSLPISQNVTVTTGTKFVPIPDDLSLAKYFRPNKQYFAYAEFTVSNLSNYAAGNAYLQWLYGVAQPYIQDHKASSISEGTLILYGFFTSVEGSSRPGISFRNTSREYTCTIKLEKLFLFETDVDYSQKLALIQNSKNLFIAKLPNEVITYNNLTPELQKELPYTDPTIIDCWGDSLTQGSGSTNYPYPTKLQELIGNSVTVNNYGQGGENAEAIAFRQGGLPAIVDPFEITGSGVTSANITGTFINGKQFESLNLSGLYNGNNRVYIDNNPFMFRRASGGVFYVGLQGDTSSVHSYTRPQLMVAEGKGVNHIIIICIGQNGWVDSDPNTLVKILQCMISHNNSTKYIVVGRPTGNTASRSEEEAVMASAFGEHFVNARKYISAYGLSDNALTPTSEDTEAMSTGAIPPQIRTDSVHMNDYGYIAMANCIYQRGKTLGYWN